jgi:hypothetical protein
MKLLVAPLALFAAMLLYCLLPAASSSLSADYSRDVRGGDPKPNCYVPGTANCPDASADCIYNACSGNPLVCPANLTETYKITTSYPFAQLTTTDPGNTQITLLTPINCWRKWSCAGCEWYDDPFNNYQCLTGQVIGDVNSRTPTQPNTNSPTCNR